MTPDQELKIYNLTTMLALVLANRQKDQAVLEQLLTRMERLDRSHAIPAFYTLRQACARFGFKPSWGHLHPEQLPAPVGNHPLRYRVTEVEALVAGREPSKGKRAPRSRSIAS
jgi:hypothetical protein